MSSAVWPCFNSLSIASSLNGLARFCVFISVLLFSSENVYTEFSTPSHGLKTAPLLCQFSDQPGPRHFPITHHTLTRNFKDFRRFLYGEAAEKTEHNHLGLARIHLASTSSASSIATISRSLDEEASSGASSRFKR